jgi:PBSX family phage terminase large subunit
MTKILSEKQLMYIKNSHAKWNLAHGSVRSGKTVCTLFRFMEACYKCPDTQIWMMGRSSETIFDNAIRLILEAPSGDIPDPLGIFRPFCSWSPGKRELRFFDKTISTVGCQNEGAIGAIQGKTFSLAYCDEITLYPESIIDMIDTRLSNPHSMGFASMNPSRPDHKVKQWIDKAIAGDKNYYELHFSLDDNPFVDQEYKDRLKNSLSGVFYKRNYLGLWCMAEGAIFDFFDRQVHVLKRPPRSAEYYIAAIDYGTSNAFCCLIAGVSTGRNEKLGKCIWIEKEYYYDSKKVGRQKTNSEYADDVEAFLDMYPIKTLYLDPSAASFKVELRRRKIAVVDADNDVLAGIETTASEMKKGNLFILDTCVNLIREIEGYVWDDAKIEKGIDAPLKKADHAIDGLRYLCKSHKVNTFDQEAYTRKLEQQARANNPLGWGWQSY